MNEQLTQKEPLKLSPELSVILTAYDDGKKRGEDIADMISKLGPLKIGLNIEKLILDEMKGNSGAYCAGFYEGCSNSGEFKPLMEELKRKDCFYLGGKPIY